MRQRKPVFFLTLLSLVLSGCSSFWHSTQNAATYAAFPVAWPEGDLLLLVGLAPVTVPEPKSFIRSALPRVWGPESTEDLSGWPDAHKWNDDDARTALWYIRNFPDDIAALGFAVHKVISFNYRDDNYGRRASAGPYLSHYDSGEKYSSIFHTRADEVVAMIDDPQLRVKMLTLEARNRNRLREQARRRQTGTWPYADSSVPRGVGPDEMDDREVERRLLETYE